jgi:HEAT repeat protein
VRKEAAIGLGHSGATSAIPQLIQLLVADVSDLRRVAAGALGDLRAASATAALEGLEKDDPDAEVRKAAERALGAIRHSARATDDGAHDVPSS